jgi:hypothetical protein
VFAVLSTTFVLRVRNTTSDSSFLAIQSIPLPQSCSPPVPLTVRMAVPLPDLEERQRNGQEPVKLRLLSQVSLLLASEAEATILKENKNYFRLTESTVCVGARDPPFCNPRSRLPMTRQQHEFFVFSPPILTVGGSPKEALSQRFFVCLTPQFLTTACKTCVI